MTIRSATSPPGGTVPPADHHQSLALPALYRGLQTGRQRILDLGPAIGSNVAFFSRLPCNLFIADLHDALFPDNAEGVVKRRDFFDELLSAELPEESGFDLVLAWDLLNYMSEIELRSLSRRLAAVCTPGAVLFALITTRKEMPNKPARFRIVDPGHLSYDIEPRVRREAPRYKEPALDRAMPEFNVESTFLLRNGMQEYLFTRSSGVS